MVYDGVRIEIGFYLGRLVNFGAALIRDGITRMVNRSEEYASRAKTATAAR